jgi:transposase
MDTSKYIFQLHGVNAAESPVLRKKATAQRDDDVLRETPPTMIAI